MINSGTNKKINLSCEKCKMKNYRLSKSSISRLVIKKFCSTCNNHTEHREEK